MRIFRICIIAVCFPMLLFVTGIFLKIMLDIAPLQTLLGVAIFFLIGILLLAVLLPSNYLGKTKRSIKDSGKEAIDTEDEPPILPQLLSIINGTDKNSISSFRVCIIGICFPVLLLVTYLFLHTMLNIAPIPTLLSIIMFFLIVILLLAILLPPNFFGEKDSVTNNLFDEESESMN